LAWAAAFKSPISSRNRVPSAAASINPGLVWPAPLNAPFSYANSSLSISSVGIAAQLTAVKGLLKLGL
jgi:hypothetical protein